MADSLTPLEQDILVSLLLRGDNVPANIADHMSRHPKSVSGRLPELAEAGLVRNKGRGVWTLTDSGVQTAQNVSLRSHSLDGESAP